MSPKSPVPTGFAVENLTPQGDFEYSNPVQRLQPGQPIQRTTTLYLMRKVQ